MSHSYEIEIKSLLGTKDRADKLLSDVKKDFPGIRLVGKGRQLNHYFNEPKDIKILKKIIGHLIPQDKISAFEKIINEGRKVSIRTRDGDGKVSFVIKASVGDDSSSNGVSRIEFETRVDKTLDELDNILIDGGLQYQAKWSREREEYSVGDINICLDKNAGYGYVAEFEKVVENADQTDTVKSELKVFMDRLGVVELPQDRLERMFAHYNSNWRDYYGTDKTFLIE